MSFEALTHLYEFQADDFPAEWLPLTHLYDPDLPLFPILYFHELDPTITDRPGERDRVFGYVYSVSITRNNESEDIASRSGAWITIATNKNLGAPANSRFIAVAENAARSRLGLDNPVKNSDIVQAFRKSQLHNANKLMNELWHKIITSSFGGKLPFGRCWDPVFGLARFIASWNSKGGRKGELIQLHSYSASFGEKISVGNGVHADFYLFPTWQEFTDKHNPLSIFKKFACLAGNNGAAAFFADKFTSRITLSNSIYSKFELSNAKQETNEDFKRLDTSALIKIINTAPKKLRQSLYENYNAFNRGPPRAVMSLLMHHDLRNSNWRPSDLGEEDWVAQYTGLKTSYQSPKVMQLYAQQCFGSETALPIDNWVSVFLKTPLNINSSKKEKASSVFSHSSIWGKLERLIWMSVQARKVHSSVADNILWCVRYGGPDKKIRLANPFSCKICAEPIRSICPAYNDIKDHKISFNNQASLDSYFFITTSSGDNTTQNQHFVSCTGQNDSYDEYSPKDKAEDFGAYPTNNQSGETITVAQFLDNY